MAQCAKNRIINFIVFICHMSKNFYRKFKCLKAAHVSRAPESSVLTRDNNRVNIAGECRRRARVRRPTQLAWPITLLQIAIINCVTMRYRGILLPTIIMRNRYIYIAHVK